MTIFSKRKKLMQDLFEKDKLYSLKEAVEIIASKYTQKCKAKFDETFEIAIKTGINTQKNETVKGSVVLPHGSGKQVKIGVFADGEDAKIASSLGVEVLTVDQVKSGKVDFDVCIATPDLMPKLAPVAKILGPRGLMPNPKLGTVTKDIAKIVKELGSGRVDFRSDKQGNINLRVGKVSFNGSQLEENIAALLNAVKLHKPTTLKGAYIVSVSVSSTMGVGVKVALDSFN